MRQIPDKKKPQVEAFNLGLKLLANQGSNLDSSGPKPDVLPVTPSANHKIKKDLLFFNTTNVTGLFF